MGIISSASGSSCWRGLDYYKSKKIDAIIIKDLSRLGRNYIETSNFIEVIFPAMGVSVISVDENCEIEIIKVNGRGKNE